MIYVASRASVEKYPREWRRLRDHEGWPINSTWIDEAGPGETADMGDLWQRIECEVRAADGLVLWAEAEDFPLQGAFVEVGMALGMGKRVAVYTRIAFENTQYKPFGSWMNHPLVKLCFSLRSALDYARGDRARFTGVGELERTGYIPAGSAAEREGDAGVKGPEHG